VGQLQHPLVIAVAYSDHSDLGLKGLKGLRGSTQVVTLFKPQRGTLRQQSAAVPSFINSSCPSLVLALTALNLSVKA
jgi:hypothetical protein